MAKVLCICSCSHMKFNPSACCHCNHSSYCGAVSVYMSYTTLFILQNQSEIVIVIMLH